MTNDLNSSQNFETFVPLYDTVPEKWDDARPFLVEQLKKISNAVNARDTGFLLEEESLSGQQFIPTAAMSGPNSSDSQQFRSVFRKVIMCSPLVPGVNTFAHGITIDVNFTLLHMYGGATNSVAFTGQPLGSADLTYNATNVIVTVAAGFDRASVTMEYIQEI